MKLWEEKDGLENRKKCKRKKKDWRWNTKGNADWKSYKTNLDTKMTMFALQMVDERKEGNGQQKCGLKSLLIIGRKQQKNQWKNLYVAGKKKNTQLVG